MSEIWKIALGTVNHLCSLPVLDIYIYAIGFFTYLAIIFILNLGYALFNNYMNIKVHLQINLL